MMAEAASQHRAQIIDISGRPGEEDSCRRGPALPNEPLVARIVDVAEAARRTACR
jgi:hypothetical protein